MNSSIKTAVTQHTKKVGGHAANYTTDGQQAYYLHRAGGQETWFTSALDAVQHWESAGGELWVGRSTRQMNKIRS